MNYFNHHASDYTTGLRESINAILESDIATGNGYTYASNFFEVESWGLDSLVTVPLRMGASVAGYTFKLADKVTRADLEKILDAIDHLEEEPVLDAGRYYELIDEALYFQLVEIAKEYEVDPDLLHETYLEGSYEYYDEGDYVHLYITDEALTELIAEVKEKGNTWDMHYSSGKFHHPEHCYYCEEAKIA